MKFFAALFATVLASNVAMAEVKTYKMYSSPNEIVNPTCDRYTKLVLDVQDGRGTATLSNHVAGGCEIAVFENKHSYKIELTESDCGTQIFHKVGDVDAGIEIKDHSFRACTDLVPSLIEVKEYNGDGRASFLFSKTN